MAAIDRLNGLASETTLGIKAPCLVATTGVNITLAGVQVIDGVTVGAGSERVLVKDQTDPTQNNIYIASTGNWTLARDAGGNTDWTAGTLVYVQSGTANIGIVFAQTTAAPVIIGTSDIVFVAQGGLSGGVPSRDATTTPIVVSPSDRIILVDTAAIGAPVSVVFPAASTLVTNTPLVTIKDKTGAALAHPITITFAGAESADGQTSLVIGTEYGWYSLKPKSTGGFAIL